MAGAGDADSEAGGNPGVASDVEEGRGLASWVDTWHLRLLGKKKNRGEGEKKGERRGGAAS